MNGEYNLLLVEDRGGVRKEFADTVRRYLASTRVDGELTVQPFANPDDLVTGLEGHIGDADPFALVMDLGMETVGGAKGPRGQENGPRSKCSTYVLEKAVVDYAHKGKHLLGGCPAGVIWSAKNLDLIRTAPGVEQWFGRMMSNPEAYPPLAIADSQVKARDGMGITQVTDFFKYVFTVYETNGHDLRQTRKHVNELLTQEGIGLNMARFLELSEVREVLADREISIADVDDEITGEWTLDGVDK
jgi:hypothetical protein